MSDNEVINEYFSWLCDIIGGVGEYSFLIKELHKFEFYWFIENDDNREEDGKALREEFANEKGYISVHELDGPCSMLEMILALACRFEGGFGYNPDDCDNVPKYFWEMLNNLGLLEYDDTHFNEEKVRYICDTFCDRNENCDTFLTIFPLKSKKLGKKWDPTTTEIWYQMQAYIEENYDF